ncbi:enoyl-CoA hydratase/isomerase family protein [Sphingomonas sediminicola]|jgi:enoyl-CoA hydratase/carnithine racemase|uniref:Enoyl-CoA hydratase/isomerase family protein n=1 Tax=Sphingomonas sediminicola TaxID=386874 RepID=A0ABX6TC34_9SPHN|nr:enoyl-CoA hydratase-related protein [Sphingomonas sediminicola]QNP46542.1 enoyl-CoA hydratase/isomerase family protein [Sphingomonas sediminicola]
MSEHVLVERKGDVLAIILARPDRRNAITVAMYAALADAVESAAGDDNVRLITLRGEGQDFTAGNDLGDFMAELPRDGSDIPVWRLLRALAKNQVPIVAAVHGNAVGIGTTMLFHCDFVIAEEGTRFLMPFVDLGLVPEAASSLILPRLAGRRRAARYLLLGEPFGPEEALDFGLVSHVAPAGQLQSITEKLVAKLKAKPAEALRLTQRLLRRGNTDELLERMELENGHFSERLTSTEVRDAINAFFAARAKPVS